MAVARTTSEIDSLAERMVRRENQAFQTFAEHFGPRFRALFLRCGLRTSDAEDLAITCITDIALKVGRFRRGSGNFEAWVLTLARHTLADWWRRHRPTQPLFEDPSTQEATESNEDLLQSVREALEKLSPDDQTIIQLRDLETEQSYTAIGQRLGIQSGAARTRHLRALQRLGDLLGQDERVRSYLERKRGREQRKAP